MKKTRPNAKKIEKSIRCIYIAVDIWQMVTRMSDKMGISFSKLIGKAILNYSKSGQYEEDLIASTEVERELEKLES